MTIRIEIESVHHERELLKAIEEKMSLVDEAIERESLREDQLVSLGVDDDGSKMTFSVAKFRTLNGSADVLKHYKDELVESLADHRLELELDKEEGKESKTYLIH